MRWSIPEAWRGHQQQTNTTPGPCEKEMNTPCQGDANLETEGKETDLRSLASQQRASVAWGVEKGRKNLHCLQGMTHTVHNGSLFANNAHILYEEGFFLS